MKKTVEAPMMLSSKETTELSRILFQPFDQGSNRIHGISTKPSQTWNVNRPTQTRHINIKNHLKGPTERIHNNGFDTLW